jgi:hypothetical protein
MPGSKASSKKNSVYKGKYSGNDEIPLDDLLVSQKHSLAKNDYSVEIDAKNSAKSTPSRNLKVAADYCSNGKNLFGSNSKPGQNFQSQDDVPSKGKLSECSNVELSVSEKLDQSSTKKDFDATEIGFNFDPLNAKNSALNQTFPNLNKNAPLTIQRDVPRKTGSQKNSTQKGSTQKNSTKKCSLTKADLPPANPTQSNQYSFPRPTDTAFSSEFTPENFKKQSPSKLPKKNRRAGVKAIPYSIFEDQIILKNVSNRQSNSLNQTLKKIALSLLDLTSTTRGLESLKTRYNKTLKFLTPQDTITINNYCTKHSNTLLPLENQILLLRDDANKTLVSLKEIS